MQIHPKKFMLALCLGAAVACAGLAGCASEGRTAGTRIDDHLTAHHVREALAHAPVYKFNDVHVEVYDGVVQLSGFAETHEQKEYAGNIAGRVQGVRQLINSIAVKPAQIVSPTGYSYGRQYPLPPASSNPQVQPDNYNNPNYNQNYNSSQPTAPAEPYSGGLNGANRQTPSSSTNNP